MPMPSPSFQRTVLSMPEQQRNSARHPSKGGTVHPGEPSAAVSEAKRDPSIDALPIRDGIKPANGTVAPINKDRARAAHGRSRPLPTMRSPLSPPVFDLARGLARVFKPPASWVSLGSIAGAPSCADHCGGELRLALGCCRIDGTVPGLSDARIPGGSKRWATRPMPKP